QPAALNLHNTRIADVITTLVSTAAPPGATLDWTVTDDQVIYISTDKGLERVLGRDAAASRMKKDQPAVAKKLPELRFDRTTLIDALGVIADRSGVKVSVDWPKVEAAGLSRQTPVSLRLRDVSVLAAGDLLIDS